MAQGSLRGGVVIRVAERALGARGAFVGRKLVTILVRRILVDLMLIWHRCTAESRATCARLGRRRRNQLADLGLSFDRCARRIGTQ